MKTALELVNPRVFELPTARDNIFFDVVHQELMRDPVNHIQEFLQEKLSTGGSSIVYVRTKDQASSLCRSLNQMNLSSTEYHRGLSEDTCKQNQQLWMSKISTNKSAGHLECVRHAGFQCPSRWIPLLVCATLSGSPSIHDIVTDL